MALKHLLLGLLTRKPSSGYSLHKAIPIPMRPTLSRIYRALNEMAAEGLADFDRVEQQKLPARNVFHITKAGYGEMRHWFRGQSELSQTREPLLQILWFGSIADKEDILANMHGYVDAKRKELQYYEDEARKNAQSSRRQQLSTLDIFYQNLVFDYVQKRIRVELEWAEAATQLISGFEPQAGRRGASKKHPYIGKDTKQ